jgi:hypothetical protein
MNQLTREKSYIDYESITEKRDWEILEGIKNKKTNKYIKIEITNKDGARIIYLKKYEWL